MKSVFLFTFVLGLTASALATAPVAIEAVLAHPPFDGYYTCGEHRKGELEYLGDDLGTDCVVQKLVTENGRTWAKAHAGDGTKNEDWYGWRARIRSPCACEVVKIAVNPVVNEPGQLGKPPASIIVLKRSDGVHFMLAHVQEISVQSGDRVAYGQAIARIGNNGYGRTPHLHIGAWRDKTAMQIRFDTSIPATSERNAE